jgi:hypothetical protein
MSNFWASHPDFAERLGKVMTQAMRDLDNDI